MDFTVTGIIKKNQLKTTCLQTVDEDCRKVLVMESDINNRPTCIFGVNIISGWIRCFRPTSLSERITVFKNWNTTITIITKCTILLSNCAPFSSECGNNNITYNKYSKHST